MVTQRQILAGPCKLDLQNSLFCGHEVRFTIHGLGTVQARIGLVEAEDGSRDSWNIQGYLKSGAHFSGHFRTNTRTGQMKVDGEDRYCQKCGKVEEILGRCKYCQD